MTMKSVSKLFTTASLLLFLESYTKIWKEKKHTRFEFYPARELFQEVPIWLDL